MPSLQPTPQSARVFISYRSQDPDATLAKEFFEENWPQRIDQELEQADYFLLLLSEKSVASEMVTEEVRRARELRDRNG